MKKPLTIQQISNLKTEHKEKILSPDGSHCYLLWSIQRKLNAYPLQLFKKKKNHRTGREYFHFFLQGQYYSITKPDKGTTRKHRSVSLMNTDTEIPDKLQGNQIQQHKKRIKRYDQVDSSNV